MPHPSRWSLRRPTVLVGVLVAALSGGAGALVLTGADLPGPFGSGDRAAAAATGSTTRPTSTVVTPSTTTTLTPTRTTTTTTRPSTTTPPTRTTTTAKPRATPGSASTPRASSTPKPSPSKPRATSTPASGDSAMAAEVLRLVNVERSKAGCGAVHRDSRIAEASRLHSKDMADHAYFDHTSQDGRSPWDRMRAQGYTNGSGENIAAGQATAAAVIKSWMGSSGHRANILACTSKAMGVGIAHGGPYGIYWTQGFGRV